MAGAMHIPHANNYWCLFDRLTPAYLFLILIYTYLLYFAMDGPYWPNPTQPPYRTLDPNCVDHWYLNILYVNNLADPITTQVTNLCFLKFHILYSFIAHVMIIS